MIDNEILDKVFNLVFGRYAKLHLFLDDGMSIGCWPKFVIIVEGKIGVWWKAVHELWISSPELVDEGLLTQLRVNVLGEDASELPVSKLESVLSWQDKLDQTTRELLTTASSADLAALRVKRYIAYGVIKLLKKHGGLVIAEDCNLARKILDVRSLEELLIKADLTA